MRSAWQAEGTTSLLGRGAFVDATALDVCRSRRRALLLRGTFDDEVVRFVEQSPGLLLMLPGCLLRKVVRRSIVVALPREGRGRAAVDTPRTGGAVLRGDSGRTGGARSLLLFLPLLAAHCGVDVRSYGARGDGATDDTAALNAAIAAEKGGTIIVSGPGTFRGVSIAVNMPGTTIKCTNGAIVQMPALRSGDGSHLFDVSASNVTFRDCTFDGNKVSHAGYPEGFNDSYMGRRYRTGIWMSNANGLTVTGNTFQNFYGAAITTREVNHVVISDSTFRDNYFESVFASTSIRSGTPNLRLTGFTFVRNKVYNTRSGNAFGDGSAQANGLLVAQYLDVRIGANVFDGVERNAVKLENCAGSPNRYSTVTDNDFRNGDLFGSIGFQSGSHYFNVDHNTCTNVGGCVGMGTVVDLQYPSDSNEYVNIRNNTVNFVHSGNMADAFQFIGYGPSLHHLTIDHNTISNVPRDAIQARQSTAIYPRSTAHDISITNNTVTRSGSCIKIITGPGYTTPTNVTSVGNSCR